MIHFIIIIGIIVIDHPLFSAWRTMCIFLMLWVIVSVFPVVNNRNFDYCFISIVVLNIIIIITSYEWSVFINYLRNWFLGQQLFVTGITWRTYWQIVMNTYGWVSMEGNHLIRIWWWIYPVKPLITDSVAAENINNGNTAQKKGILCSYDLYQFFWKCSLKSDNMGHSDHLKLCMQSLPAQISFFRNWS